MVGNYESVRLMRATGVHDAQIIATAGGDTLDCGHGVTVRALPSQHSGLYALARRTALPAPGIRGSNHRPPQALITPWV